MPVTVATAREIEANGGRRSPTRCNAKPGISGSTFAPGANRPIIRGLDNYRVRVQENGIGTHDVSALSRRPRGADRSVRRRSGRGRARAGDAALRRQAIGGVVNATNDRIPTFVPPAAITAEVKGGLTSVDEGRDGAFKVTAGSGGSCRPCRRLQAHGRRLRHARTALQLQHVRRQQRRLGRRLASSAPTASSASPRALRQPLRHPGRGGRRGALAHRHGAGQDHVQGRVARRTPPASRPSASGSVRPTTPTTNCRRRRGTSRRLALHQPRDGGRVEIQHMPVMTGLGELTGAVGIAARPPQHARPELRGGHAARAGRQTDSVAAFMVRGAAGDAATAPAGGGPHRARPRSTAPGSTSPIRWRPSSSAAIARSCRFGASIGAALRAAAGRRRARSPAQYVERAPDAAELFSKGTHEATGTFEIGDPNLSEEKARTVEAGLKRATGRPALRHLGLLHAVRRLHLQAAHRRHVRGDARRMLAERRRRTRIQAAAVPRSATRPSTAPSSLAQYDVARSGTACGASKGSTISCTPSSMTASTCRASPRTGSAAASTTTTPAGSPASAPCTPSPRTRSASTRRDDQRLHARQRRAELHDEARDPGGARR